MTSDECVEMVRETGSLLLHPLMGGLDPDLAWESLELVASKVNTSPRRARIARAAAPDLHPASPARGESRRDPDQLPGTGRSTARAAWCPTVSARTDRIATS